MVSYDLDDILLSHKRFWKFETIIEQSIFNPKSLEEWINSYNEKALKSKRHLIEIKKEVMIVPEDMSDIEEVRFAIEQPSQLIFSKEERQQIILLLFFYNQAPYSISFFKALFYSSKNTILSDIKQLRQNLEAHEIKLDYQLSKGFFLVGNELMIRQFVFKALQNLSDQGYYCLSKTINHNNPLELFKINQTLREIIQKNQVNLVYSRYQPLLFFTELLLKRVKTHPLEDVLPKRIYSFDLKAFEQEFNGGERDYFIALVFGSSDGAFQIKGLDFLYRLSFQIMENVMKLAAMEFEDFTKTFEALLEHLGPAYFRLTYHLELKNDLLPRIKQEYHELFTLICHALSPLTELTQEISEEELAYFVILFGGEIYKKKHHSHLKAIVLCANGISSSLIMKKRLVSLFPNMEFVIATSISQFDAIPVSTYDMIFSTLKVESQKKVYLFSPFPSNEEVRSLYNQIVHDFELPSLPYFSEDQLIKLIKPYLKKDVNLQALKKTLQQKIKLNISENRKDSPMLSELLVGDTIQFTDQKMNWEEAINFAANPLIESKTIEPSYIDAMINRIKEFGPFVDLGMGIALPHARPEDGVNKVGMSFLRCQEPINLLDDPKHSIKIFIVLSAVDNEAHLRALSALTQILSDHEQLQALLNATSVAEVENILKTKGETK